MKKLLVLLTLFSSQAYGAIQCFSEVTENKRIGVIISFITNDVLKATQPFVIFVEEDTSDNKLKKTITYHIAREERLPAIMIHLDHDTYKHIGVSGIAFNQNPSNTKVILFHENGKGRVILNCPNQANEIERMFFNEDEN